MKKIFTLFSIIFALLAGFNACGNTTNITQDNNDSESTGDTAYGVNYSLKKP